MCRTRLEQVMDRLGTDLPGLGKSPLMELASNPLDALILTILSQATSDQNSARAYHRLRDHFANWDGAADAPISQIEEAIRPGGLAAQKAPRIRAVLRKIREERGGLELGFLRELDDPQVDRYLTSLPGVGPKTAACVRLFGLGRPVLPVDTHVHRVAGRLGLIPASWPAGRAQNYLEATVPAERQGELHLRLIDIGRSSCRPRRPLCHKCPFGDICVAFAPQ